MRKIVLAQIAGRERIKTAVWPGLAPNEHLTCDPEMLFVCYVEGGLGQEYLKSLKDSAPNV
jgi:hypothetical protein